MAKINVVNFMSNVGRESWFHRLDPRTKVFVLVFFTTIPLLFTDFRFYLVYLALILPIWLTSNIDFRPMIGPFVAVGIFLFTLFLLTAVRDVSELTNATQYGPWSVYTWYIRLGPLVMTDHSIAWGLFVALRLLAPMTTGLLIIATTDPTILAKGIRKLKVPMTVLFMVQAGLRFIPIVTEQLFNILDAMTIRGVSSSPFQRLRLLALPLLITSLRRTRTMGLACEAKGFSARRWNNFYEPFNLSVPDKAIMIGLALVTIASLIVRYGFGLGGERIGGFR
jgi:energy-coupling factor transport system permease protein